MFLPRELSEGNRRDSQLRDHLCTGSSVAGGAGLERFTTNGRVRITGVGKPW